MSEQRLIAGQNTELDSETLVFTVHPAHVEVAALVLDDQRRPLDLPGAGYSDASNPAGSPGINAETSRLTIRLGALPDTAARVLCIALTPHPDREALTCALAHDAGHATVFDVSAADATTSVPSLPWHVAVAATVAGVVWSTEMATRRRMVGESVEGPLVSRALAGLLVALLLSPLLACDPRTIAHRGR